MSEIDVTVYPTEKGRAAIRYEKVIHFCMEDDGRVLRVTQQFKHGKVINFWFRENIDRFRVEEYADEQGQADEGTTSDQGDERATSQSSTPADS